MPPLPLFRHRQRDCGGQLDGSRAGITSQGNGNLIRENVITGNVGGGIKLASALPGYGVYNAVTGNSIISMQNPQGTMCGNTLQDNKGKYYSYGYPCGPEASC